jgi:hypothetical protein
MLPSKMRSLTEELVEVMSVLNHDELMCQENGKLHGENEQFWRRMLVRSFFAQVEGTCYRMKQYVKTAAPFFDHIQLSNQQKAKLDDLRYDPENDRICQEESYIDLASNVIYSFEIFAEAHGDESAIDLDRGQQPRWASFKHSISLRNRVTHPKRAADLEIGNDEVSDLIEASEWYEARIAEAKELALGRARKELDEMLRDIVAPSNERST